MKKINHIFLFYLLLIVVVDVSMLITVKSICQGREVIQLSVALLCQGVMLFSFWDIEKSKQRLAPLLSSWLEGGMGEKMVVVGWLFFMTLVSIWLMWRGLRGIGVFGYGC